MNPSKQTFFVFGLSRSGKAVAEFLLNRQAVVYIYDERLEERIEQVAEELQKKGARLLRKEDLGKAIELCDALVLSPGVPIDHPFAVAFKRKGKAVLGEMELAARYMRCPLIAVTGTNGKTTTVSMLEAVFKQSGISAKACGNIGEPMIDFCELGREEVAVVEVSSFQLETLNSLCPHVAIVLNISEDHLNRHYNMENYIFLKAKLLKNSTETEFAVLNYDDGVVREFAEKTKARVIYFSVRERVSGAFYENGDLYFGKERIMSADDLPLGGLHNIQNALAVIAAAKIMGIKTSDIVAALVGFKGIRHRMEYVARVDGVTYIDDSKGTNVDATLKAIAAMKTDTVVLLGGKNKGYDYGKLFAVFPKSKVTHAVLYGENRYLLLKNAREHHFHNVTVCDKFAFAVQVAALKAQNGQTVLLSPASASFDEFADYAERGDEFVRIVHTFMENTQENDGECGEENKESEKEEEVGEAESERGEITFESTSSVATNALVEGGDDCIFKRFEHFEEESE